MIPYIRFEFPAPVQHSREQFALIPFSSVEALAGCTRAEIITFNALALHADPQGHCWPGRERLAAITRLNPSRISRATSGLESKGLIRKRVIEGVRVEYFLLPQLRPLATPEPVTPVQNGTPPVPFQAPEQIIELTKEPREATPEPATPEPATVASVPALSQEVLRTDQPRTSRTGLTEDWTLPDHFRQIAQQMRPDLVDSLEGIADNFRDYHLSRATKSAAWIGEWRIWLRRERGPRPTQTPAKPFVVQPATSPYATWQPGQKAPVGVQITPEFAIASFERDMQAMGAVKQSDGTWRRPATDPIPAPVTDPIKSDPPPALPTPSRREQLLAEVAKLEELYRQGGRDAVLGRKVDQ